MATWDLNDEQANFLDVQDLAHNSGPQLIKRGEQRLYVISESDLRAAKESRRADLEALRKTG